MSLLVVKVHFPIDVAILISILRHDGVSEHRAVPETMMNVGTRLEWTCVMVDTNNKSSIHIIRYIRGHENLCPYTLFVFHLVVVLISLVHYELV